MILIETFEDSFSLAVLRIFFFDISSTLEIKKRALKAHKSEMRRHKYDWYNYFINKAYIDGIKINTKAAESFFSFKSID